jgi:cupin fold WbuC family metalloprotein
MPFRFINEQLINEVSTAAKNSSLQRSYFTFHQSDQELAHRLVKAVEPGSYIRPHKHNKPDKSQTFIVLRGKFVVVLFAEDGRVSEHVVLEAGKSPWGVEIPPTEWHMMMALETGTVVYEVVEGPWDPTTHKTYPTWAPDENDEPAAQGFIAKIRQELMLY